MIRVNVVVEGQTEETFVRNVLYDYFVNRSIFLNPIIVKTSKIGKGGGSSYGKIKNDIKRACLQDQTAWVTTMFDYYGLPKNFPGKESLNGDIYTVVTHLENAFKIDINQTKFIPNLILHEYEGLLFSDLNAFSGSTEESVISNLREQTAKFASPEHINDNIATAPSKRILSLFPSYQKIFHGSLIASTIGIDVIRNKCRHFNEWLQKLEALGK